MGRLIRQPSPLTAATARSPPRPLHALAADSLLTRSPARGCHAWRKHALPRHEQERTRAVVLCAARAQSGRAPTPEYAAAEAELHAFLTAHVESLDPGTTVGLLAGAGRTHELLIYAQARSDHAAVLEALLQVSACTWAPCVCMRRGQSPTVRLCARRNASAEHGCGVRGARVA